MSGVKQMERYWLLFGLLLNIIELNKDDSKQSQVAESTLP